MDQATLDYINNNFATAAAAQSWITDGSIDPDTGDYVYNIDPSMQATYLAASKWLSSDTTGSSTSTGSTSTGTGSTGSSTSPLTTIGTVAGIAGGAGQAKNLFGGGTSATQQTLAQDQLNQSIANANVARYGAGAVDPSTIGEAGDPDTGVTYGQEAANATTEVNNAQQASLNAAKNPGGISGILQNPTVQAVGEGGASAILLDNGYRDIQSEVNNPTAMGALKSAGYLAAGGFAVSMLLSNPVVDSYLWAGISSIFGAGAGTFGPALYLFLTSPWGAIAIVAIIAAIAILTALLGQKKEAPPTPTAAAINAATAQLNSVPWYSGMSAATVGILTAGLTIGSTAYSLSPQNLSQQFSVPTSQLASAAQTNTGQTASSAARIFVYSGAGVNGSDLVYYVTPSQTQPGYSTVSMMDVNANGYVIGPNGTPATDYPALFSPIVDNTGKIVNVQKNVGALNAIEQIPECTALAKNASALNGCVAAYKGVNLMPS